MRTQSSLTVLLFAAVVTLSGCGGGGAKVEASTSTTTTTMGQELMDLDKAYKAGIIDEKQYDAAKKKILKRYED